jgi:RIO-like serine/threonine protein kinase
MPGVQTVVKPGMVVLEEYQLGAALVSDARSAVYTLTSHPDALAKLTDSSTTPSPEAECQMLRKAAEIGVAPNVIAAGVDVATGLFVVVMQRLQTMDGSNALNVGDFYGFDMAGETPEIAEKQIVDILDQLYDIGIYFHDRTIYNFLVDEHRGEVLAIDFEHAEDVGVSVPAEERKYAWNKDFF